MPSLHRSGSARILLLALWVGGGALLSGPEPTCAQTQFEITIPTTLGDTTETFWLQIPRGYQPGSLRPLLLGWHQLGGNRNEMRLASAFDSIADARGWIAASHDGVSSTHWNNQPTQSHVVDVIRWIEERYSVDPDRIYMVGASMGGAAGMVFANNHLDPQGPMVAAAASISGIQDCERRFHEQGINHSMIASFGGTPEQVPFEYHRNSAICFADSTESMHVNARHLPLYLTFGHGASDQVWREHAEDLYAVLAPSADTVVIRESAQSGHGWGCAEEGRICDFLGSFTLERRPHRISIEADEEGRWYWAEIRMRDPVDSFARFEGQARVGQRRLDVTMIRNVAHAELDLPSFDFPLDPGSFTCRWSILDGSASELSFLGMADAPARVLRDGVEFTNWVHDPGRASLTLSAEGSGLYVVVSDPAEVRMAVSSDGATPVLVLLSGAHGSLLAQLREAGTFSWQLCDVTGRELSSGPPRWFPPGQVRLVPPIPRTSGVFFVHVMLAGPGGKARSALRFVILR